MKLLLDEDLSPKIAIILRERGIDVLSVYEIGCAGLTDQEQLEYAASEGRCFVTRNRNDYIILTRQFFSSNISHKGVLIISSSYKPNDFKEIADAILGYVSGWQENPTDYLFDFI
ncbi:MAG: DUF5615 family PIN-like protein [Nitrospirae bacterium]|nr:DUF5615 family PIN-like protein [Nitrospirota bacterium]